MTQIKETEKAVSIATENQKEMIENFNRVYEGIRSLTIVKSAILSSGRIITAVFGSGHRWFTCEILPNGKWYKV